MNDGSSDSYSTLVEQVLALVDGERDYVANMANASSLLYNEFLKAGRSANWIGFYIARSPDELVLGPFMGEPACIRIRRGKGVCGTAMDEAKTQLVPDVHEFDGHIACSAATNSEIVVPVFHRGVVVAVLDLDSTEFSHFTEDDVVGLERIAQIIGDGCDWPNLKELE